MNKMFGFCLGVIVGAVYIHFPIVGITLGCSVLLFTALLIWRSYLLTKQYEAAFLLEYKSDKFDYVKEYEGFMLRFWCWDVKKYIDRKVDQPN